MNSLSLPDANDDELLAALKAGDAGALDVLLKRYWSPLIAYLTRMIGSPDAAEDIAQRTFHRLWERRTSWRTAGSVRGLLYRIAHNLAVSEYRMERARQRADSLAGDSPAHASTPLAAVEDAELREMLDRAIQALPPRRREVFVLRCIHDMPYRDIAEVLGISQQTVANQLSRALTTLRLILRPQLDR